MTAERAAVRQFFRFAAVTDRRYKGLHFAFCISHSPLTLPAMKIIGIIPARYGSTRFPGKPLARIAGKTLLQHVVERCQRAGHGTFDYGREHVFFAGEVVVDQALTDAGLGGDLGDFGGLESLESEHLESSVQDLVTALVSDFLVGQACSW